MKRKVLFLIESLSGGGAEKVLSILLKHFDHERYEVIVCPIVDTGIYCEEVRRCVSHYVPIVSYHGGFVSRILNRMKYKLIYSALPLSWGYRLFIPKGNDVEIAFCEGFVTKLLAHAKSESQKIAWIHTDLTTNPWPIELGIYRNVGEERTCYSKMDRIVCVSQTVEQSFHERYGLSSKTCTIYNPIDIEDIRQKAAQSLNEGVLPKGVFHLVSIGRLVPEKGYDRLLTVVKRLADEKHQIYLTILGEGQERETLERIIKENNMQDYVSLPGFAKNPYALLSTADLFVCSSRAEGFSLVIAEAMALGIPVLSTYCSGPNELLDEGRCGILVKNTEEDLYQGLKRVLQGGIQVDTYSLQASERIQEFSACSITKKVERLFDEG